MPEPSIPRLGHVHPLLWAPLLQATVPPVIRLSWRMRRVGLVLAVSCCCVFLLPVAYCCCLSGPSLFCEQCCLFPALPCFAGYSFVFVSLNRFERKKNIRLALEALAYLRSLQADLQDKVSQAGAMRRPAAVAAGPGDTDDGSVVLEVGIHSCCKSCSPIITSTSRFNV